MDITKPYVVHMSPRVVFGINSAQQTGAELARLGVSHALVVTDSGLVQTEIPALVTKSLDAAGVKWSLFGEVEPNPSIDTGKSPPPATTGVPGRSPVRAAAASVTSPITACDAWTGAKRPKSTPTASAISEE